MNARARAALTRSLLPTALVAATSIAVLLPPLPVADAQEAPVAEAQDALAPVVDATLDAMRGGQRSLAAERGRRVVVLFYEDRPHVEDNDVLKGELRRFVVDNHLDERVVLYGVANLADVGMVPQAMVRRMISPLVERWGSDILLDWRGVMRQAPFSFASDAANVAIIGRDGRIVWRHVGTVDSDRRREFYRALRGALAAR